MPEVKQSLGANDLAAVIWPLLNGRFFPGSNEDQLMSLQDITFSDNPEISKLEKQEHGKWGNVFVQRSIVCVVRNARKEIEEILLTKRGGGHRATTSKSLLTSGLPKLSSRQILTNKVDIGTAISEVCFSRLGYGFSGSEGIHYYFDISCAEFQRTPASVSSKISLDTAEFRPIGEASAAIGQKRLEMNVLEYLLRSPR